MDVLNSNKILIEKDPFSTDASQILPELDDRTVPAIHFTPLIYGTFARDRYYNCGIPYYSAFARFDQSPMAISASVNACGKRLCMLG